MEWLLVVLALSLSSTFQTTNPETLVDASARCYAAIQVLELFNKLFGRHSIACSVCEEALDGLFTHTRAGRRRLGRVAEFEVIRIEVGYFV